MIDFLKNIGITDEIINLIEENNTDNEIYSLYCNQDECLKIIDFFQKIGIKNIEQLLIYEIDVFYNLYGDVIKKFSRFDLKSAVNFINNNYKVIEQIMNSE